ncbi:hypothetical protein SNSL254_A2936 [Salmonella enterica subsp. enterica serovar Newport str. SL254]|uniref:Uncharacterized protein n=2 Tax=Salmonella enterica I TaxID=59201 RepID=C0PX72_SALPC|nr:hypothetical protein SNSL254_A2936 [Salmonella enterica subsp. enterica serovar Newport str. SL254]ACN45054.1 hypothetical protein SPC_0884 [Salmonella enterica subsp. enterica serovar Paratyphi C str. RKS4594]AGS30801.1 hypothetical protein SN31241_38300 [Salmonella enterica subsp. enterica serovar Newport str. USMARC-S3124.1]
MPNKTIAALRFILNSSDITLYRMQTNYHHRFFITATA